MDKRLNGIFKRMAKCCPAEVAAYGACVASFGNSVEKNACNEQFIALRECFLRLRYGKK
jgi:hypothetical protein